MAQRKTLTQRQIDVLRWIGDGCPEGVEEGCSERITAGALRNRGLVTTRGKGATWSAAITAAGIEYLAQVDGPNPPVLPAVLMEVETVAAEVRERLEIERQETERRRLAWEEAMTAARARHTEHHRAEILDVQIDAWQRACVIRDYCDAVEKEHAGDAGAAEWVAWARAHADLIDPLVSALVVPEPPTKVPPEELVPYLDGWSPYGPERATRHRY